MKIDLQDITFLVLVRLDSVERLENTIVIANCLTRYFNTNIYVLEVAAYSNGILKQALNKKLKYCFVEDKDPILHKTMYYNRMVKASNTPFISIWDTDTVVDKDAIVSVAEHLRNGEAEMAFPYNGICMDTSDILREFYLKKRNVKILYRHKSKMNCLYNKALVGGAVFFSKEKFLKIGMDNERHYGWGNDDFDRFCRAQNFGLKIYNTDNCLFHLSHPRGINSCFRSDAQYYISSDELHKIKSSSKEEIRKILY
jgi:predicted glycosyltransferase involved in capsule biosynthesis